MTLLSKASAVNDSQFVAGRYQLQSLLGRGQELSDG
jgi:hypothetical protein